MRSLFWRRRRSLFAFALAAQALVAAVGFGTLGWSFQSSARAAEPELTYPLQARPPTTPLVGADHDHPALIVDPTEFRPDPSIIWDPEVQRYRMYGSMRLDGRVPMWVSDHVEGPWTWAGDALSRPPDWAAAGGVLWTPEVTRINGVWTLWGSAGMHDNPAVCMYRATGPTAAGPFTPDPGPSPYCDISVGGTIDPQAVRDDDGTWWLVFKINSNVYGQRTELDVSRLSADGHLTGPVTTLVTAELPWMKDLIEAPAFVRDPVTRRWWLTFSAGKFSGDTANYRIAAVPCDGPGGPCDMSALVTLVSTNEQGVGPGEQSVLIDLDGGTWLSYNPSAPFVASNDRPLALVRLGFNDAGVPYAARP
jgi:beta-xylosidase